MSLPLDCALVIDLSKFSSILVTRKIGEQLRQKVEEEIKLSQKNLIVLNFAGVKIIDYSFADESIVKLLLRIISGEFEGKQLILTNVDEGLKENIEVALIQRQTAILIVNHCGNIGLIGYLKEQLKETFKIVLLEQQISARRLAEVQGTTVNVSNNRLLELTKMKLLSRKEQIISGGGKQYLYYLPLMKGEDSSE